MQLSLSGRQFETPEGISKTPEEFISFAAQVGFRGVELRGGHLSPATTDDEAAAIRDLLQTHGLRCVFATGPEPDSEENLAAFQRLIDLAAMVGSLFVRCGGRSLELVPQYRELAQYAADRGVGVISQLHNGTQFANLDLALNILAEIDHPNYGVAFEANHLVFDGQPEHGEGAVRRIADHIKAVSVQAYKPWSEGAREQKIQINDRDWVACLPGDPDGVDFPSVFRGLHGIGFEGFVTCMPGSLVQLSPEDQARRYFDYFAPLVHPWPV
jgi:sugar phosphate isomerase/epimerase